MKDFFKMQYYDMDKKSFKNGLKDLKESNINILTNIKLFLIVSAIFLFIAFIKEHLIGSFVLNGQNFSTENSLMLQGEPSFDFVFSIFGFFISLWIYFFTIDMFSNLKESSIKDSIKFSITKLFDYRIYILALTFFLTTMLAFKIAIYPFLNLLPENINTVMIIEYFQGLISLSANIGFNNQEAILSFVNSKEEYVNITNAISQIITNPVSTIFYVSMAVLLFILNTVFHFSMLVNMIIFNGMTFFEALKASCKLNINNGLYFFATTLQIFGMVIITVLLSHYTSIKDNYIVEIFFNNILAIYSLYIFSFIIAKITKEKK